MTDEEFKSFIELVKSKSFEDWKIGEAIWKERRDLFTNDQIGHILAYNVSYSFLEKTPDLNSKGGSFLKRHYLKYE